MTDDPRPLLRAALDQVEALALAGTDHLDTPTPCAGWAVRDLLHHVVAVENRMVRTARGATAAEVTPPPPIAAGDHRSVLAEYRAALDRTWGLDGASDDVLDQVLDLPWGRHPGRVAALGFTQEMTVHAWDLATALGRVDALDPALAEAVIEGARRFVPAEGREHMPFDAVVDVDEHAGAYARLVAWLGRDPAVAA